MSVNLKTLTSVENEYLSKSGKKRRQRTLTDETEFPNANTTPVNNQLEQNEKEELRTNSNEKDSHQTNSVHVHFDNVKEEKQESTESTEIKNEDESDEDYDELEIIRQLSSIKLESDEDEDEDEEAEAEGENEGKQKNNDKDRDKDTNENEKEIKIYNKKEAIDAKIKTKTKKRTKEPASYLLDDSEIECVEDAVIYDESKDTEFPDLHKLFIEYNETYFYGKLNTVEVKWSNKMKLCAGICVYKRSGYCCIRLSLPLLKLRKIKEYRETLLHEMIHAFLFLTRKNSSHDGHGPEFKKHMYRINRATGLSISIYHSFHDEVNFYRNHVWRCTGPCRKYPPHFGYIKRSMNRPPGPKEKWWRKHASYCNGRFMKIQSGENENNETRELKPGDMYKDGKPILNLKELTINTKPPVKAKKTRKDKKRQFGKTSEVLQDAIIILDSKDFRKKQMSFEETDIVNLIKILFNDNKNNVITIPDASIDYKKPFEDKNYFEIDSD